MIDDGYEPNNDIPEASNVGQSGYLADMAQYDFDYYEIYVLSGNTLFVNLTGESTEYYNMELYDSAYSYLSGGVSDYPGQIGLTWTNYDSNNRSVYVRVIGDNYGALYNLDYSQYIEDDVYEENDFVYEATWISPSHYDLIQLDSDWFNITIPAGDMLNISLNFDGAKNNIQLFLFNESGGVLDSSTSPDSWEQVTHYAEYTQTVSFHVFGENNGEPYCMDVLSYYYIPEPVDDGFEENDYRHEASWIVPDYYYDLYQGDDDWYNISVAPGYILEVEIWFNGSANDIDMQFFDNSGNDMGGSYSVSDYESFSYYNMQDWQNISFRVYGYNNYELYTMEVELFEDNTDDWMEDNDYNAQRSWLGLPFGGCNLRNFDEDWYEFHLESGDVADLKFVNFDNGNSLRVEIWDQSWTSVFDVTVSIPHTISVEANSGPMDYYVRVTGVNMGGYYDMEVFLNGIGPNSDDSFEPNDYDGDAAFLGLPFEDWGLRSFNEDWYQIYLDAGDYVDIYVWNSNPADYLRLVMYDTEWNEIKNQTLYSDTTGPIYVNPAVSGNYYILITTDSYDFYGNHYDLRIDLNGQQVDTDDWAEDNDDRANSYMLTGPGYFDSLVCKDEDWFSFGPVFEQETLRIELRYDRVNFLGLELVDETGSPHGFSIYEETWGKTLEWTAHGNYTNVYFRISGDYDTWYAFDLFLDVNDDWMEENDVFEDAWGLYLPFKEPGLMNWDDDWFNFYLNYDDLIEIKIDNLQVDELYLEFRSQNNDYSETMILYQGENTFNFTCSNPQDYYLLVYGPDVGGVYDLNILLNGQEENGDDWMEENDGINDAWDISFGRHDGLTQFDLDWYRVWLEPNDQLEVELYYDNQGGNVYIRIDGPNNGDWYDLELKLTPGTVNPISPSMDWVAFDSGDWAEWDASVEVFSETENSSIYEGMLRGDITNVFLTNHSVAVESNMQWNNIPMDYLEGLTSGAYDFNIEADGFAYPAYFGFASTFVGKGFHYAETQLLFENLEGFTYQILDSGRTLELESVASADLYFKMRITYTEEGLLKEIIWEGDFVDPAGIAFGKGKINLMLRDASFWDGTNTDDPTNNGTTPDDGGGDDGGDPFSGFDLSSIPGFPLEIVGSVLGFTIIAMIVVVKKKSKKLF